MKHLPEETDRDNHGDIFVKDSNGRCLAKCEKFQHNKNFRNRQQLAGDIISQVEEKMKAEALSPESPKAAMHQEVCEPLVQGADAGSVTVKGA